MKVLRAIVKVSCAKMRGISSGIVAEITFPAAAPGQILEHVRVAIVLGAQTHDAHGHVGIAEFAHDVLVMRRLLGVRGVGARARWRQCIRGWGCIAQRQ